MARTAPDPLTLLVAPDALVVRTHEVLSAPGEVPVRTRPVDHRYVRVDALYSDEAVEEAWLCVSEEIPRYGARTVIEAAVDCVEREK